MVYSKQHYLQMQEIYGQIYDENRPGGEFSKNWYKQIAVALGTGINLTLSSLLFDLILEFHLQSCTAGSIKMDFPIKR